MDFKNIKKFIDMAKQEGVSELKYETKEVKISVNFNDTNTPHVVTAPINHQPQVASTNIEKNQESKVSSDQGVHVISSPFVGTFYSSPSPGKPAYVQVGDKVSKGQTLCILEAMKIMNEIESDVSGEIVEICTQNESLCEFGQTLFKIKV